MLQSSKPVPNDSRLCSLAPEFDPDTNLIRVGGHLRCSEDLELCTIHPVVLDPKHPITQLLIAEYDQKLLHPGPERVFAGIRHHYWILKGRQAIRKHQFSCFECRKLKGNPTTV